MKSALFLLTLLSSVPSFAATSYDCGGRFELTFSRTLLTGTDQVHIRAHGGPADSINAYDSIDTTLPYARPDESIIPHFDVFEDARPSFVSRRPNPWILQLSRESAVGSERIRGTLMTAIRSFGAGVELDCTRE